VSRWTVWARSRSGLKIIVTLGRGRCGARAELSHGRPRLWVPAYRDVVNGIGIKPPEEESDCAVADAVLQVLEKAPLHQFGEYPTRDPECCRSRAQCLGRPTKINLAVLRRPPMGCWWRRLGIM
jgi:hypothetical protein